jgi:hypothetical protein
MNNAAIFKPIKFRNLEVKNRIFPTMGSNPPQAIFAVCRWLCHSETKVRGRFSEKGCGPLRRYA